MIWFPTWVPKFLFAWKTGCYSFPATLLPRTSNSGWKNATYCYIFSNRWTKRPMEPRGEMSQQWFLGWKSMIVSCRIFSAKLGALHPFQCASKLPIQKGRPWRWTGSGRQNCEHTSIHWLYVSICTYLCIYICFTIYWQIMANYWNFCIFMSLWNPRIFRFRRLVTCRI